MKYLSVLLVLFSLTAQANLEQVKSNKPLYELGLIGGGGYVPDYPGSKEGRLRSIGAPIFRYRGLRFRSDEEDSMKARLHTHAVYGFDLSAAGAFSSQSDTNEARKGMKDLDWIGELGPRFYLFLYKSEKLWVRAFLPVRGAISTDLRGATWRGTVIAPAVSARYYFDKTRFNSIIFSLTRAYTTHQLQEYYYQVDSKYATAERAQYNAKSGYLRSTASLSFIHEKGNIGFYGSLAYNSFRGAANSGSPLHTADENFAAFLGFSYYFFQSEEKGYL